MPVQGEPTRRRPGVQNRNRIVLNWKLTRGRLWLLSFPSPSLVHLFLGFNFSPEGRGLMGEEAQPEPRGSALMLRFKLVAGEMHLHPIMAASLYVRDSLASLGVGGGDRE